MLDCRSNRVVAQIPVGTGPYALDFSPDGSRAYVAASEPTPFWPSTRARASSRAATPADGPGSPAFRPTEKYCSLQPRRRHSFDSRRRHARAARLVKSRTPNRL